MCNSSLSSTVLVSSLPSRNQETSHGSKCLPDYFPSPYKSSVFFALRYQNLYLSHWGHTPGGVQQCTENAQRTEDSLGTSCLSLRTRTVHDQTSKGTIVMHLLNTGQLHIFLLSILNTQVLIVPSCTQWLVMCPLLGRPRCPPVFLCSGCTLDGLESGVKP